MQTILTPNMELMIHRLRKGIDATPLKAELLGRNWIGPARKNLLIPKDAENRLMINVIRGKVDLRSSNVDNVTPASFFG